MLDNLWLGQDGLLRHRITALRRRVEARAILTEFLGDNIPDLESSFADLDLGMRQVAVIARSLLLRPRLLILDEATAALDIVTRDRLFTALRRRKAKGLSILFITHKMDEIASLADEVTVLRSGETVATLDVAEATATRLLELMSGRSEQAAPVTTGVRETVAAPCLTAVALSLRVGARPFDLAIRTGDIFGLAGLEGHGADAVAQILGKVLAPVSGQVSCSATVSVAYVPRDRKLEGIFAPLSVADNFAISTLSRHTRLGLLNQASMAAVRAPLFARLGVKFGSQHDAITSLSGGNQQKVILARTLAQKPQVLVLNDPTRGVDLATKQDIYALLVEQAQAGMAVVIHSTEIEELLALCHHVAVFHNSTLHRVLDRSNLTRETLIACLFGRGL